MSPTVFIVELWIALAIFVKNLVYFCAAALARLTISARRTDTIVHAVAGERDVTMYMKTYTRLARAYDENPVPMRMRFWLNRAGISESCAVTLADGCEIVVPCKK